jgi:DNA modification methylase
VCGKCGAIREDKQIGLEATPQDYIDKMVSVFREVKRVLRDDGTAWVNIGDSYSGSGKGQFSDGEHDPKKKKTDGMKLVSGIVYENTKPKDLIGIPWMLAFALRNDGWYLRQDIIWHKPNPMPESVTDRCTKSHEYIFLLSKNARYYYDADAIKEKAVMNRWGGKTPMNVNNSKDTEDINNGLTRERDMMTEYRNKRSVWSVPSASFKESHFATFPPDLITPCILAGCPVGGVVLDPFFGSGTTGAVAKEYGRKYIGVELNAEYIKMAKRRLAEVDVPLPMVYHSGDVTDMVEV